jgi:Na+/H+-dicarboxylate symporter
VLFICHGDVIRLSRNCNPHFARELTALANVLRPGVGAHLTPPAPCRHGDVVTQLLDNIPDSLLHPFVDNEVIGVALIAAAFGVAARRLPDEQHELAETLCETGFSRCS